MEKQKEIEVLNQTQQTTYHSATKDERKQHLFQHKEKHKSNKEAFMDGSKSIGSKVGFAALFKDTTRRGALKNSNERQRKERGFEMGYIYRFDELNASHRE